MDKDVDNIESVEREKIRDSGRISIKEGFFAAMMEGFGTRYITPFALALGASNFLIGLLSTLPGLLGNLSQLHALNLMKERSRKSIVTISIFIQALLWLPLIFLGLYFYFSSSDSIIIPILLLIFYSLMIIAGNTVSPVWNSWMKDLVLVNKGVYFGKRSRVINISIICSMIVSGILLSYFTDGSVVIGFVLIFFLAFLGRLASAFLLTRQYEPKYKYENDAYFSLYEFVRGMLKNNFGRFVFFVSLVSFATNIAGPFFAVYMLQNLGFSYFEFTIITIVPIVSMIVFLPLWGKFSDKYGTVKTIKITSLLIPFLPFLWFFSYFFKSNPLVLVGYLVLVEIFSGFSWAGFNLTISNFIYDAVTRKKMAFCVAYFNILNAFFIFLGGFIGGLIISFDYNYFSFDKILMLFILSGFLRMIIALFIQNGIKEVREVHDFVVRNKIKQELDKTKVILWRYLGIIPIRVNHHHH